ncbi:MAG: DEAD/DEAH box helicase [Gammaproteobacteria bacterium]|nr:DEAD/DEAH box helicase [Gammaproteobacteria bacterium]
MSDEQIIQFAQLALAAPILKVIDEVGYEAPSPIQAAAIPPLLEGRDLLGQAQTGTGKTAAFALPLLSRLDLSLLQPQILVLAPTRELAIQVAEAMQTYARHLKGFHVLPVYGGQSMEAQLRPLKRGVHVVVGTPGRIQDHLRRGTLKLDKLAALVLDEADEMLRMGFIDDVEQILEHTPKTKQVALFSATMPPAIQKIAQRFLRDPVEIKIANKTTTVAAITQRYWQVTGTHKLDALTRILEAEDFDAMIVFVRTKTATVELAEKLEARGFSAAPLNGDMNQALRERTVDRLKKGSLDILVATDVAARGLDVERISHVLNYDIPNDVEPYVHRIGRTGRAGRKGTAILFVSPREKRMLRAIEQATRQPIEPMNLPTHEDIADRRVAQFKQTLSETLEAQDLAFFENVVESYQQEHNVALSEIAAALAFLVQKERPLLMAPTPPERPAHEPVRERSDRGDRKDRGERPPRRTEREPRGEDTRPPRRVRDTAPGMERFRLEVGRAQNIQPKHIVGAIANEAGIDSQYIDNISIQDDYSTVDLPEGMPKDVLRHLQKTWICGQPMRIHRDGEPAPVDSRGADKPSRPRTDKMTLGERPARSGKPIHGDKPVRITTLPRGDKPSRAGKPSKPSKPGHGKTDKARKPRKP